MTAARVDTRHEYAGLEAIYLWIAAVVFAVVALAIAVAVIRYRRRGHDQHPGGRDEHNLLEGIYVAVLAAIAAFLVGATFAVEDRTDRVTDRPGLRVDVSVAQWNWRFSYPAAGVTSFRGPRTQTILTVPTGTEVAFHATSRDVVHSFWVPGTRFKRDVFPHSTTTFDLMWKHPGWYRGECAEFCGVLHADMRFSVHALPPAAFRRWLAAQRRRAG
jgi:cytochrome c oxidase subunit II